MQIRLSKTSLSNQEKKAVLRVLNKEFLGMGEEVGKFEKELTLYFKRYVSLVNTGTSAIQLCLEGLDIGQLDEVLVPSITYLSSYQAISAAGAKPIAVDVDPLTGNLSMKNLNKYLTKKTKALLWVHYAGDPSGFILCKKFCKEHQIHLIEDAAHAFGSKLNGIQVGCLDKYTCFSFDGIKNITSGEGGAVVTSDKKLKKYVDDARLLGVKNDSKKRFKYLRTWKPEVNIQGWRYHMSDINAAIGRVQLKRSNIFFKHRKKLARYYDRQLKNVKNIVLFDRNYDQVVPHIYPIKVENGLRNKLKNFLNKKGIQTGIHYFPNHRLSKYKTTYNLVNSETLYSQLLTLPLHFDLKKKNIDFICEMIKSFSK